MKSVAQSSSSKAKRVAVALVDEHRGRRLQRGADGLGGAGLLQRLGDDTAHRAHALDALGQRVVLPLGRQRGEDTQVHAGVVRVAGEPGLLGREADEGREPGGQAVEQRVEHGAHARRREANAPGSQ